MWSAVVADDAWGAGVFAAEVGSAGVVNADGIADGPADVDVCCGIR